MTYEPFLRDELSEAMAVAGQEGYPVDEVSIALVLLVAAYFIIKAVKTRRLRGLLGSGSEPIGLQRKHDQGKRTRGERNDE